MPIPSTVAILDFLTQIGLSCRSTDLPDPTFLPGLTIRNGEILYDESRLLYPGDLLHEAGHLAMLPAAERPSTTAPLNPDGGYEMAAIAWSYAAALHLRLPVEIVFHPEGYRGDAGNLIENFTAGRYIGVPLLEWANLTSTGARAEALHVAAYPHMIRWLRE